MKKQVTQKGLSTGTKIGIGASLAAAGVAAYLLFGKDGKKNRKIVRGWAVKMKGEIIEKFEKAENLTETVYHNVVDQVSARYAKMKDVDQEELKELITDIRKHWKNMTKGAKPKAKTKAKPKAKSKKK